MASFLTNRVKFATATTGTGAITIGAAAATFYTPATAVPVVPDGAQLSLVIANGSDVELSTGIYNLAAGTITRNLVQSTTGALLNLGGAALVSVTALAADIANDPHDLSQPATPPAVGKARLGTRTYAGFQSPTYDTSQGGPERMMQPSLLRGPTFAFRGLAGMAGTTNLSYFGWILNQFTASGSATARTPATAGGRATRAARAGYVSGATAGTTIAHYIGTNSRQFTLGDGAGMGGFVFSYRFMISDAATVAGARMFVGMCGLTTAPGNVNPATVTDSIGIAQVDGSNNMNIVYGGSVAQASIDLGASFPAGSLSTDLYELMLYSDPSDNSYVGYRVERLNTGDVASGTIPNTTPGTTLSATSTLLGPRMWRTNNATALAVGMDIVSCTIQTDY